jgi:integrase
MQHQTNRLRPASGHVYRVERQRGDQWYAKYRQPDGRQVQRRLGPTWTGRGRPPEGWFTKQTAERELRRILGDADQGKLPGQIRTGATFRDAAEDWYQHGQHERALKPSTLRDYRSVLDAHLLPAFGDLRLEDINAQVVQTWRAERMTGKRPLSRRNANKLVAILHGIYERARRHYGLPANPIADVERFAEKYDSARYSFYSPEEVMALVRAAASEQDGAIYLTAAFTGLRRGELLALRWRDVDFEADSIRVLESADAREGAGTTKSGKGRSVPMVADVATALACLSVRPIFIDPHDLVFPGQTGGHLDGSALRRRYQHAQAAAKLQPIRFHDLRHTFGSLAIRTANVVEVQSWMGHADHKTTFRYLHHRPRADEAKRLAAAFAVEQPAVADTANG